MTELKLSPSGRTLGYLPTRMLPPGACARRFRAKADLRGLRVGPALCVLSLDPWGSPAHADLVSLRTGENLLRVGHDLRDCLSAAKAFRPDDVAACLPSPSRDPAQAGVIPFDLETFRRLAPEPVRPEACQEQSRAARALLAPCAADETSGACETRRARDGRAALQEFFRIWRLDEFMPVDLASLSAFDPGSWSRGLAVARGAPECGSPNPKTGEYGENYLIGKDPNGNPAPHCAPDTLYAWGGPFQLEVLRDRLHGARWQLPEDRTQHASAVPIGSFGYGPIAFRFKLRPGTLAVPVEQRNTCLGLRDLGATSEDFDTAVYTRESGSPPMREYLICSAAVIESWSSGTPEHFDEMLAELRWRLSHGSRESLQFVREGPLVDHRLDGHFGADFSRRALLERMARARSTAARGEGELYHAPGVERERARHFRTERPIYFNAE